MQTEKKAPALLRVVNARQSNHSSFILPPELSAFGECALYRYVAYWSLIHNKYICCDDVATHFGISVRQATNIISLIHCRYSDVIQCKIKRIKSEKNNVIKTHILVTDVDFESRRRKVVKKVDPIKTDERFALRNLRDLFLYKKNPALIS